MPGRSCRSRQRLVEEHDLEQAGAVVDGRVHDRALAVARPAGVDRPHLGVDGRLLADLELVDLGPLGAVDVAARVVLEQVEHGLDAHLRQPGAQLVADGLQLGDAVRRELAQREAAAVDGWATPSGYSTPMRYG